jgi:hypothetical protein
MKSKEEIEQLTELYTNKIVEVAYHNFPLVHPKETVSKVITALLKEYTTQCQEDMADKKYTLRDIEKAFLEGCASERRFSRRIDELDKYIISLNKQDI